MLVWSIRLANGPAYQSSLVSLQKRPSHYVHTVTLSFGSSLWYLIILRLRINRVNEKKTALHSWEGRKINRKEKKRLEVPDDTSHQMSLDICWEPYNTCT